MKIQPDSIRDILTESGCSFKKNSRSFILTCPRCRKREKLYIRQYDGRFVCWYCKEIDNFQGKPEYALVELSSLSLQEIQKRIYGDVSNLPEDDIIIFRPEDFLEDDEVTLFSEPILGAIKFTPDIFPLTNEYCKPGLEYLASRGVSLELATRYGVMYSPAEKRVIFPVSYNNQLFGWQGRYIGAEEFFDDETNEIVKIPKALTSLGLKKDKALMFRENLKGKEHCVICEGPFDGIKADLCGGNVVTMGKAVSKDQLGIIRNHGVKKVYLALDPDAAAEIRRIFEYFKDLELYDMRPRDGRDLGKMTTQEVKQLFDKAERIDNTKMIVYVKDHYEAL
jgi:5S rRNA maturation endonuclease (ribonuclease M5)